MSTLEQMRQWSYALVGVKLRRSQFRNPRRLKLSGGIIVHTAENATDLVLPDDGAEGVASYMVRRTTPGSYHSIYDQDSTVHPVPVWMEAYHDGTGSNRHTIGVSFACHAEQWPMLIARYPEWVRGALDQAGKYLAIYIRMIQEETGIVVPLERISGADIEARRPGFSTHKEREDYAGTPGRRSDPGEHFPWAGLFEAIERHQLVGDDAMTPEQEAKLDRALEAIDEVHAIVRAVHTPKAIIRGAYDLIFNRKPDRSGYGYWFDHVKQGGSVYKMMSLMSRSPETED